MRKKGDANDAPARGDPYSGCNDQYDAADVIRPTLSPYFITAFVRVVSISLKLKVMNAAQEESTCLLFSSFHERGVPKKHYLPSHLLDRLSRGRTVSPTQARVHTHHLFYKPRVFLDVQCMYIKILSLTWFRHIKWGETSRNLPFVFSETLAMGQKRFAREMKYWRRPSYASFTICLWNVPDTTRCLFWIYRSHIGNFHIFVRRLVNSNKS